MLVVELSVGSKKEDSILDKFLGAFSEGDGERLVSLKSAVMKDALLREQLADEVLDLVVHGDLEAINTLAGNGSSLGLFSWDELNDISPGIKLIIALFQIIPNLSL